MKPLKAAFLVILLSLGAGRELRAQGQCSFTAIPGPFSFGPYSPLGPSPLDSAATIGIQCNPGSSGLISVDLSPGNGSYAARFMLSGSERLYYNLYLDAARTVVWGNGTGGTGHFTVNKPKGDWLYATITVYGRVFPGQDVLPGLYQDTITVTINW